MSKSHHTPHSRRLLPPVSTLCAFETVARTGSFTLAAVELALSQSAVSREVKSLEERLGVKLFHRTRQGVVPTVAGTTYVERVRALLDELAAATRDASGTQQNCAVLRLGIPPTFGARWLIPRMAEFFTQHPSIDVRFASPPASLFDFAQEKLDAIVHVGEAEWPGTRAVRFADQEMIVMATPALAAQAASNPNLNGIALLRYSEDLEAWAEWCRHISLRLDDEHRAITFETYQMVLQAAVAGLGIAIVPWILADQELSAGTLVPVRPERIRTGRGIYFVYPRANDDNVAIIHFRNWLMRFTEARSEIDVAAP